MTSNISGSKENVSACGGLCPAGEANYAWEATTNGLTRNGLGPTDGLTQIATRRKTLILLFSGAALAFIAACQKKKKSSTDQAIDPTNPFPDDPISTKDANHSSTISTTASGCTWISTVDPKQDTTIITDANHPYIPIVRFYGPLDHTTVAIGINLSYVGEDTLSQVQLRDERGRILARQRITPKHIDTRFNIRPIVFDNLNLQNTGAIWVILGKGLNPTSYLSYKTTITQETYNGKPVTAPTPMTANNASLIPFPIITIDRTAIENDFSLTDIWYQALPTTPYKINLGDVTGQAVFATDMLGRILSNLNLSEYPRFLLYGPLAPGYLRVMVRLN